MIDYDCSACEQLREDAPNFVVNGMGDTEVTSLQNNTGLNPSSGNDDCEDLNAMNDCLVKNMETEIDSYNVCSWKEYVKALVGNLWTVNKGIISAICGLWTKVNCVYDGLVALADAIGSTVGAQSFVRYYRDNSGQHGTQYYWDAITGDSHTLDIYMDCDVDDPGSTPADKDYIVTIANCTDMQYPQRLVLDVTYYSSGDTDPLETIRLRRAQHPTYIGSELSEFSWTTSGSVLIKKGEHIKVNAYVVGAGGSENARFRLHQFVLTWIPVNISEAIDPGEIIEC
jgi:hypothetical protein